MEPRLSSSGQPATSERPSRSERFKARLYTVWCWTGCGLSTAFWATVSILASFFSTSGNLQHFCMRRWSRDNLWLSRARVQIEGLEHVDPSRPQLFAANHSGLHDILALSAHLPIQFRWVAKKSLFNVPFMGWHMARCGYVPIDRDNPRDAAKSIAAAGKMIRGGTHSIAFPEGTRSRTGEIGSFKSGTFALALRAQVPLVPVSVEGSYRVIMPKTLQVNPGTIIRIKIERPLDLSNYHRSDKNRLMTEVHEIMAKNLDELRRRRRKDEQRSDLVYRWIYTDVPHVS